MKKEQIATLIISIIMYFLFVAGTLIYATKGDILSTASCILMAGMWQMAITLWVAGYITEQVKKEITEKNSK